MSKHMKPKHPRHDRTRSLEARLAAVIRRKARLGKAWRLSAPIGLSREFAL